MKVGTYLLKWFTYKGKYKDSCVKKVINEQVFSYCICFYMLVE